jgi:hypothetical protein
MAAQVKEMLDFQRLEPFIFQFVSSPKQLTRLGLAESEKVRDDVG